MRSALVIEYIGKPARKNTLFEIQKRLECHNGIKMVSSQYLDGQQRLYCLRFLLPYFSNQFEFKNLESEIDAEMSKIGFKKIKSGLFVSEP